MKRFDKIFFFLLFPCLLNTLPVHSQHRGKLRNVHKKVVSKEPQGPDTSRPLLLSEKITDPNLASLVELLDVWMDQVFYDKNINADVFYYLPGSFSLDWDQKKGKYQYDITYPEDNTGEKNVQISARFSSSMNSNMVSLLEKLLCNITNRKDVQALPMPLADSPVVNFPFDAYNIAEENITLNQFSDFTKPITASWSMPQDDVEPFVAAMADNVAFDGNINWKAKGLHTPVEVPIHFSLISSKTIGQFYYTGTSSLFYTGFENKTDFRLKLKSIKVLNKYKEGKLLFDEIPLANTIIEPRTTYKKFPGRIKTKINPYPAHLLLTYEILPCEECERNAVVSVLKNGIATLDKTVEVWDLGAFKLTNALAIKLEVENVDNNIYIEKEQRIKEAFTAQRLLNGSMKYRYKIIIILPDGPLKSKTIESSETSIFLTADLIKKHFEEFRI